MCASTCIGGQGQNIRTAMEELAKIGVGLSKQCKVWIVWIVERNVQCAEFRDGIWGRADGCCCLRGGMSS